MVHIIVVSVILVTEDVRSAYQKVLLLDRWKILRKLQ